MATNKGKTASQSQASRLGDLAAYHPAVLAARRHVRHCEERAEHQEHEARVARENANRADKQVEDANKRYTSDSLMRELRQTATTLAETAARIFGWASDERQSLHRARRELLGVQASAKTAPMPSPDDLDWRISPVVIDAQRALDEAETRLAERMQAATDAAKAVTEARETAAAAEGRFLTGRGSEIDADRAKDAAEIARRELVRASAEREAAEATLAAAQATLVTAEAEAREIAVVALNVMYGQAVADLAVALEAGAEANGRMRELYALATSQFPMTQSAADAGGQPTAAGLPTGLDLTHLLDDRSPHTRSALVMWRRRLQAAGYQIGATSATRGQEAQEDNEDDRGASSTTGAGQAAGATVSA